MAINDGTEPLYVVVKLKSVNRGVNRNYVVAYRQPHQTGEYSVVTTTTTYNLAVALRDHLNDPSAKDIDPKYQPLMLDNA